MSRKKVRAPKHINSKAAGLLETLESMRTEGGGQGKPKLLLEPVCLRSLAGDKHSVLTCLRCHMEDGTHAYCAPNMKYSAATRRHYQKVLMLTFGDIERAVAKDPKTFTPELIAEILWHYHKSTEVNGHRMKKIKKFNGSRNGASKFGNDLYLKMSRCNNHTLQIAAMLFIEMKQACAQVCRQDKTIAIAKTAVNDPKHPENLETFLSETAKLLAEPLDCSLQNVDWSYFSKNLSFS